MSEITEDRPMTYRADDGAFIVLSVAGPERVFTLTVSGERLLTTLNEDYARAMARRESESHNARAAAPGQIASPLVEGERQCSGLVGGGAAANAMSVPVRDMLDGARTAFDGLAWRGRLKDGNYPVTMLRAAARRGWLELDNRVRPSWGRLTDAGRRALAVELARTGGAR